MDAEKITTSVCNENFLNLDFPAKLFLINAMGLNFIGVDRMAVSAYMQNQPGHVTNLLAGILTPLSFGVGGVWSWLVVVLVTFFNGFFGTTLSLKYAYGIAGESIVPCNSKVLGLFALTLFIGLAVMIPMFYNVADTHILHYFKDYSEGVFRRFQEWVWETRIEVDEESGDRGVDKDFGTQFMFALLFAAIAIAIAWGAGQIDGWALNLSDEEAREKIRNFYPFKRKMHENPNPPTPYESSS